MVLVGDCSDLLKTLPQKSVQCCVTSPPYWGLRDYEAWDQVGVEATPEDYVSRLMTVFEQVWRVLKDDGTLWLNLGDSYARNDGASGGGNKEFQHMNDGVQKRMTRIPLDSGLKEKDLVGIPWQVAFALRKVGWYLRQDIIWHKPNPMPESVTDRCTKAHEYVFLLSKHQKYYFDVQAIKEPAITTRFGKITGRGGRGYSAARGNDRDQSGGFPNSTGTRQKRSVWTVTTKSFKGAHFATFPPDLVEPCILAGSRPGDTILDPFFGAGTTGLVASKNGRKYVGIELNSEYAKMAEERIFYGGL